MYQTPEGHRIRCKVWQYLPNTAVRLYNHLPINISCRMQLYMGLRWYLCMGIPPLGADTPTSRNIYPCAHFHKYPKLFLWPALIQIYIMWPQVLLCMRPSRATTLVWSTPHPQQHRFAFLCSSVPGTFRYGVAWDSLRWQGLHEGDPVPLPWGEALFCLETGCHRCLAKNSNRWGMHNLDP